MCSDCKGNKKGWIPREENSPNFLFHYFLPDSNSIGAFDLVHFRQGVDGWA
jgi:hypothetical protein